jgi:hypothetical protein
MDTNGQQTLNALRAVGIGDGLVSVIGMCFDQMQWAEDEIKKAQERHPEQAELIWNQFMLLHTPIPMPVERVYRSHARELLERVAVGEDTTEATNAELAVICSEASLQGPLDPVGVLVYTRVFRRAFPEMGERLLGDYDTLEADFGQAADKLERAMREEAHQPERIVET